MITVRPAAERGHFNHGWLDTHHTFSFADYYDPEHMGFRALRVINEDRVAPGQGFGTHPHRDMEIITYVMAGALQHKDSMGNGSVIHAGDVQRMTAGTGVTHSEFNASAEEPVHLLQIWILPDKKNLEPGYEQKAMGELPQKGSWTLVASPPGKEGGLTVHQDVRLWRAALEKGKGASLAVARGRHLWIQVARGAVTLNGKSLAVGDGASFRQTTSLTVKAQNPADVLVFDLP